MSNETTNRFLNTNITGGGGLATGYLVNIWVFMSSFLISLCGVVALLWEGVPAGVTQGDTRASFLHASNLSGMVARSLCRVSGMQDRVKRMVAMQEAAEDIVEKARSERLPPGERVAAQPP